MALDYRPDIDGLRALAVLPVVAFHLGQPWAPGGFVGVDVFFVISGFLITSIIRHDLAAGTFTLAGFYERRIRRILPALFVVIVASLVAATLIFLPMPLRDAGQSAVAAAFFASNILFWIEDGYFQTAAYNKPLLHTWSLAIEEQFYIFVPLLLMGLSRLGRRPVVWVGLLTLLSFALSAGTTDRMPTSAYYLLPWRAWELGIGALLALGAVPALRGRTLRGAMAAGGIAAILAAVVLFDKSTSFPGAAALLPTLGTAMVLHAGASGPTVVGRMLGTALPVWIGRRSYSLYLWHWPLVVFYTYVTLDLPDAGAALGLFALSLLLADLSLRYVETPFRRPGRAGHRRIFAGAGAGMAIVVAGGLVPVLGNGLPGRLPPDAKLMAAFAEDRDAFARGCERRQNDDDWTEPCLFGAPDAGPARIALLGDSHGPALVPALDRAGREAGVAVEMFAHNGCPNFVDFQVFWVGQSHDCTPYVEATYETILADPDIEVVIYTLRAQLYAHGWPEHGFAESGRRALLIGPRSGPLGARADRTAFFLNRLEGAVRQFRDAGKQVVIVYPLPEAGKHVPEAAARVIARGGRLQDLSVPRAQYDGRAARIIEGYDRIVAAHDLIAIRTQDMLCDAVSCDLFLSGVPLFRDTNHLTRTAAHHFGAEFARAVQALGPRP